MHQQRLISLGFFSQLFAARKLIHIETSGTILIDRRLMFDGGIWLTVAPKQGVLDEMIALASEIRFLVDENFDPSKLPEKVLRHRNVFLSPINDEKTHIQSNINLVKDKWLRQFPHWRLSAQWHKYLGVR